LHKCRLLFHFLRKCCPKGFLFLALSALAYFSEIALQ
jgi:hypothetical protein